MDSLFSRVWWMYLLRGLFAVAFGLLAIFMPVAGFTAIVLFVGAYMFIDGSFSAAAAIAGRKTYRYWGWLLAFGLLGVAAGILTFFNPLAAGIVLVYFIAAWALIIGIAEIMWAVRLRKEIEGEGWYILSGVLSIVFSLVAFFSPIAGAVTLAMIFGIYLLIIGIILISLSLRLRKKRSRRIPVH